jgi:glycosyltransferase involved in cell wall biosynthesis
MNIVHVGRLVEKKGTLVLLLALAEASKLGLALHLRVVGDGPLRGRLERATGALGLSECVHFLGFQPHDRTLGFIREADALCLPSLVARNGDAEGFGMVMLEAASLGTPIIATESGGILDFVEAGRTGILVPPGDPRALSRAFVTLHEVPELVHHMVTEARRRVEMDFDVVKQTVLLEERFEHLLG